MESRGISTLSQARKRKKWVIPRQRYLRLRLPAKVSFPSSAVDQEMIKKLIEKFDREIYDAAMTSPPLSVILLRRVHTFHNPRRTPPRPRIFPGWRHADHLAHHPREAALPHLFQQPLRLLSDRKSVV